MSDHRSRRRFLGGAAAFAVSASIRRSRGAAAEVRPVNDVSGLNPVRVRVERRPRSTEDVEKLLGESRGAVSIGGGRFSMGGQIAEPGSLHLDIRQMNAVLAFDPEARVVRAQAGATWRDIQDVIDSHDLSLKIMQSYSNFTVGGSIAVNCHGRYVRRGPLINALRSMRVVTASGLSMEVSRSSNRELFGAIAGGYGGLAVVTEAEFDLAPNYRIARRVEDVGLREYPEYFRSVVERDPLAMLHNADLMPPSFDRPRMTTWFRTEKPLTEHRRLIPRGLHYGFEQNSIWAISELPGGSLLRETAARQTLFAPAVVLQNYEASLDTASLEPRTRSISTYLLQEYFIPVERFVEFSRALARILAGANVNALNVSVRHSPQDTESLLRWAKTDVFSFVLYYKQRSTAVADAHSARWTRALIAEALRNGGRYYLPYRLHATPEQFRQAYPEHQVFARLKAEWDPQRRFRNLLWDKYLSA